MRSIEEDEILYDANSNGGRPKKVGGSVWKDPNQVEISSVGEDSSLRLHLGYCRCGRRIVAGSKRAGYLRDALERMHVERRSSKVPLRVRIGRMLLAESDLST